MRPAVVAIAITCDVSLLLGRYGFAACDAATGWKRSIIDCLTLSVSVGSGWSRVTMFEILRATLCTRLLRPLLLARTIPVTSGSFNAFVFKVQVYP